MKIRLFASLKDDFGSSFIEIPNIKNINIKDLKQLLVHQYGMDLSTGLSQTITLLLLDFQDSGHAAPVLTNPQLIPYFLLKTKSNEFCFLIVYHMHLSNCHLNLNYG